MKKITFYLCFVILLCAITPLLDAQQYGSIGGECEPILNDTLPDGTIVDLLSGEEVKSNYRSPMMKALARPDKPLNVQAEAKRIGAGQEGHLKTVSLINSLNNAATPYYREKMDSIISYESRMMADYDSLRTQIVTSEFDENGFETERIVKVYDEDIQEWEDSLKTVCEPDVATNRVKTRIDYLWDEVTEQWVQSSKYEYVYDNNGSEMLELRYSWNALSAGWDLSYKEEREYDEDNKVLYWKIYDVEEFGEDVVASKYEYAYDSNGNRTLFLYCGGWNPELSTWRVQVKTETVYDQENRLSSYVYKRFNVESAVWENVNKYQYNYLEDGSVEESYYLWDPAAEVLVLVSQSRYKFEQLFDDGKLVQEIRSDYDYNYGDWQAIWKKVYEYDQWGYEVFYEKYELSWGYEEIRERRIREYTASGRLYKLEEYYWDEEIYDLRGTWFWEYQLVEADRTLSYTMYKWDEENREWLIDYCYHHSYPDDANMIVDRYEYEVSGYSPGFIMDEVTRLEYDQSIGRYTLFGSGWGTTAQISYNEDLKVDEIVWWDYDEEEGKTECYYDALGRDTAWYYFAKEEGDWVFDRKITLSYEDLNNGQQRITELWLYDYESYWSAIYIEGGKIISTVNRAYDRVSGLGEVLDSTVYSYSDLGLIELVEAVSGEDLWKSELVFANDTLTIWGYYKENIGDEWELESKDVYKVDPAFRKEHFQQPPVAYYEDFEWFHGQELLYDYGLVLENIYYYSEGGEEMTLESKMAYFYSEAPVLSGDGVVSGYVFEEEQSELKSVSITNEASGVPLSNTEISLCEKEGDAVLASVTTDSDGFYKFLGVPQGMFYLKVGLEGFEQLSTYDIHVSYDQTIFKGKNFKVTDGTIATGMDDGLAETIIVYPNPTKGKVSVSGLSKGRRNIILLLDGSGRVVQSYKVDSGQFEVDLSDFVSGIYYIKCSGSENNVVKVVKE